MGLFSRPIVNWLNRERKAREFPLSDFERIRYELRPCDIILVEGRSRVSEVIKTITQSPWSHAALYIGHLHDIHDSELKRFVIDHYDGDPGERQLIVESQLGLGTVVRSISVYDQEHLRLCRPKGLSYQDSQLVCRFAIEQLGVAYDVRQIFDLARFLFPWAILPKRFRSSLFKHNAGGSTRTVCSSMIASAFAAVQFPILPLVKRTDASKVQLFRRNPKLCTPSDFDYSPYFEIIKYPFMDFQSHSNYRLLPWQGTGVLDADEADLYMKPNAPSPQNPASQATE